jgi:hypothetical protein
MIGYIAQFGDISKMIIVELGAFTGNATKIFHYNFNFVIAVDKWEDYFQMSGVDFKEAEKQFDKDIQLFTNVWKHKNNSIDAADKIDQLVDIVYIDALHTYDAVKADIKAWWPKIKPGGFLAGHDYHAKWPGVIQAVDEFKKPDCVFCDTSWIIRKDNDKN